MKRAALTLFINVLVGELALLLAYGADDTME
jgi:hypothetical protein